MKTTLLKRAISAVCLLYVFTILACSVSSYRDITSGNAGNESLYDKMIGVYRGPLNHLSAVRSGECPMHPSCSEYSRQAVARHGFAKGWIMSMDRLMRCGRDETRLAPRIRINGRWKYYDPVEGNDFWWRKETHQPDMSRNSYLDSGDGWFRAQAGLSNPPFFEAMRAPPP
jgi:putative component of membrane protein insertase Oxa1/YidC/SpoIIIJ protein YidD